VGAESRGGDRHAELRAREYGEWQGLPEQPRECVNGSGCHRETERENY
jgi:hypothetical protein